MGALRTSLLLIPIAHTLITAPFVVRTLLPILRSLDPPAARATSVMETSPLRAVVGSGTCPCCGRRCWWAVFAFTISLGEFGATLLISRRSAHHARRHLPRPQPAWSAQLPAPGPWL
ncbi:MAG: hypothetical protein R2856_11355 [Caldilineaceae bacterium]